MKLAKTIIVDGKLVSAGTDIATEGLDASRIPEAALEVKGRRDLSKDDNTAWLNIAAGCRLTKLLKTGVPGKDVKAEAEKLGEPYARNIASCKGNAKYDLYEAEVTYDQEAGTWGMHVIAVSQKQILETVKQGKNNAKRSNALQAAFKDIDADGIRNAMAMLLKAACNAKLQRVFAGCAHAAADSVRERYPEDAYWLTIAD